MTATFQPDPNLTRLAEAYALDAIDFATKSFHVTLDWTDDSIERVEGILAKLHASMPHEKPPEDTVWTFAKGLGSYVGEVYRKNHGGEWGVITHEGHAFPGVRAGTTMFWPWGRVHQRLVSGPENNVWHYYNALLGR